MIALNNNESPIDRNSRGMNGRLVVDAIEWRLTLTKIQPVVFNNKIKILQSKFNFYIKLYFNMLSKGTREWTTLKRIRSGFGCAKSSIKMGGQPENGQPNLRLHLQT